MSMTNSTQERNKLFLEAISKIDVSNEDTNRIAEALAIFNQKFAVIAEGNKAWVMNYADATQLRFLSPHDFKEIYQNVIEYVVEIVEKNNQPKETIKAFTIPKIWLQWPERKFFEHGLIFDPTNKADTHQQYNLWKGLVMEESPTGSYEIWEDHALNNICSGNQEMYDYQYNFWAHAVQKPWELPKMAQVLRGPKGVGKNVFIQPLMDIFKNYSGTYTQVDHVLGKHNDHQANKLIICLDELIWGGYKQMEGVLKGLITGPSKMIEPKFRSVFEVNNFNRVYICSNEEWAVPATSDERRFNFINVPEHEFMVKHVPDYFPQLIKQMNNGGTAKLLYDLRRHDISKFNPMIIPEGNQNRGADIIERSFGIEQLWIHDWLTEYGPDNLRTLEQHVEFTDINKNLPYPSDKINEIYSALIFAAFKKSCKDQNKPYTRMSKDFTNILKKMIPVATRRGTANKLVLIIPNAETCRKFYAEKILQNPLYDWGDCDIIENNKMTLLNEICA